jgi:hypothetical protein|eukprot:COSAG06_NODE_5557_length_3404_cov_1.466566_2_plen_180_part_00
MRSYDFTARVTNTKFDRKYWHIVECELGRMFRSPGFNKQYRKREQPVVHLPARELWLQRERQRRNAHLVTTRPSTSGGKQVRSNTGRIPLYGLVAATGQSPIILSAFRRPVPPGETPPSTAPGRRRRPNTQQGGSSRASTAVPGSRSARTYGSGSRGSGRGVVAPVNMMGTTNAWGNER